MAAAVQVSVAVLKLLVAVAFAVVEPVPVGRVQPAAVAEKELDVGQ